MGSKLNETSKALLVLEHTSKEEHIEKLFGQHASKPKIERLTSSVLQRVQQFLPQLQDANDHTGEDKELCCEVGENFGGPAIQMTLMMTGEQDQLSKIVETLEKAPTSEEPNSDTADDSDTESSSDEV